MYYMYCKYFYTVQYKHTQGLFVNYLIKNILVLIVWIWRQIIINVTNERELWIESREKQSFTTEAYRVEMECFQKWMHHCFTQ